MNLSFEDARLFFELMWSLQHFGNQRYGILEDISSPDKYAKLPAEKKLEAREALWKSPDLIDDYVKENPESLSTENLEIVHRWKGFIKGEYFIFRHLKNYTIFIGNKDQVYGVLGLFDSIENIIPRNILPVISETVLLPFKGRIVYDGLLRSYSVSFGGGIQKELNHTYLAAKQKERIITTLEPGGSNVQSAAIKVAKSRLHQLEEIALSASKLKGDTALQSATFNLLRASIELAKCVDNNPDDLDALFSKERKIYTATRRLSTVLNIETEN
jgi:hypothetical protein